MPRKPAPLKVMIDGTEVTCPVVERLGFNHDIGAYAAVVVHDGGEKTAVKRPGGTWRLWMPRDRVRPLREHILQSAAAGVAPFGPPGAPRVGAAPAAEGD